ncbi:hypothetical protein F1559_005065 [Cyanidiococcus yangmingshanensis]|uniref:Uncharacterized protein n=1 Tax=Cyanidiococcus yangmingshanensis TaxID=2690220 RepID=A0A7J7IQS0_9RHOD|nr:hypothetical protein F1559_005065 [Cyanidiococcus yangmingshanensis]
MPTSPSIIRSWLENADQGNEALIIAFKDQIPGQGNLIQVLSLLLPLLNPGHPFVVWSPWLQPLAQVHALMCASEGSRGVYPPISGEYTDPTVECTTISVGSADGKRGAIDDPVTQVGGSADLESDPQPDQSVIEEHNPGHAATNVLQQVAHVRLTEITTYGHQFVAERTASVDVAYTAEAVLFCQDFEYSFERGRNDLMQWSHCLAWRLGGGGTYSEPLFRCRTYECMLVGMVAFLATVFDLAPLLSCLTAAFCESVWWNGLCQRTLLVTVVAAS